MSDRTAVGSCRRASGATPERRDVLPATDGGTRRRRRPPGTARHCHGASGAPASCWLVLSIVAPDLDAGRADVPRVERFADRTDDR